MSFEDLRLDPPLIKQNNNNNNNNNSNNKSPDDNNQGDVSTPEDSDFASASEPMISSLSIGVSKADRSQSMLTTTTSPTTTAGTVSSLGTTSTNSSCLADGHSASVAYHSHRPRHLQTTTSTEGNRMQSAELHRQQMQQQPQQQQQPQTLDESLDQHELYMNSTGTGFTNHSTGMKYSMKMSPYDDIDHGYDDDDDEEENDDEEFDFYTEENIAVNALATLEIILPHELLEKNLQIRIAPDVEDFDIIYRTTFHKVNPIILYCFERYDEKLSEVDIAHLQQLRTILPTSPILFAHIVDFDPSYQGCMSFSSSFSYNQHRNAFYNNTFGQYHPKGSPVFGGSTNVNNNTYVSTQSPTLDEGGNSGKSNHGKS